MVVKSRIAFRHSPFAVRCSFFGICILYLVFATGGFSQIKIQGTIIGKESGKPLPGANIVIENTSVSAVSDENGKYLLHLININRQDKGQVNNREQRTEKSEKLTPFSIKITFMGYRAIQRDIIVHRDTVIDFAMEPSPILGEEVNIIATRVQANTPVTFTTMTNKEIQSVNLGKDMPFILQSTPSVVTTSDAGTGVGYTSISIRGSDLSRINVTMNGIPINDAETQGVWFVDLPDLASSAQNIQVQRGAGTSTNGAGAFGASINIRTMELSPDAFAELVASGGSFGTLKTTFRFGSGLIANKFAVEGRASYITSDGYIDRAWSKLKSYAISAGYLGQKTTLKFNFMSGWEKTYQAWTGVPKDSLPTYRTYNPSGEFIDQYGQRAYYQNQTDNYNQDHYQLIFSQEISKDLNLNTALFYTHGKGYYENYEPGKPFSGYGLNDLVIGSDTITIADMITQKWLDNDFYGLTFSGNYNSGYKLKITLGGAWCNYFGEHYGKIIWSQYASNGDNERNWYYSTGGKSDFNIFLKVNYQLFKRLYLFADMQYRNVNYIITGDKDDLMPVDQTHVFNFFNPKAGIYYTINDRQDIYFSFSVANREPNRNNYEVADSSNIPRPERLYDFELGYNLKLASFSGGICLYYMKYHDQLVLTGKINNVGEPIMTNVPNSYRTGMEISAGAPLFKWLKWNFSSTISMNKIKDFTEYVDNYDSSGAFAGQTSATLGTTLISFSPGIIATNSFTFQPLKGMTIALNSRYISRQYIDNTSDKSRSLDPYFINGLTLGYEFHAKPFSRIGFNLTVNNLFSNKYESSAWVYRYNYAGQPYEMNGYFPQALVNFLFGISIKI